MVRSLLVKNSVHWRRVNWSLREIERSSDGNYALLYDTPDGVREVKTRSVALTVPAYVAADLVRRECPDAASFLKGIDYPPVAAVSLAYPKSSLRRDRLDAQGDLSGRIGLQPWVPSAIMSALQRAQRVVHPLKSCNGCLQQSFATVVLLGLGDIHTNWSGLIQAFPWPQGLASCIRGRRALSPWAQSTPAACSLGVRRTATRTCCATSAAQQIARSRTNLMMR